MSFGIIINILKPKVQINSFNENWLSQDDDNELELSLKCKYSVNLSKRIELKDI